MAFWKYTENTNGNDEYLICDKISTYLARISSIFHIHTYEERELQDHRVIIEIITVDKGI